MMKKTTTLSGKHTPGPWRYERQNPSPTTGEHMIAGGKPGYLAEVRDCGSGDVAANALLIAAAPELLEALKAVLPYLNAPIGMAEWAASVVAKAAGGAA
jgi:hypothetical protein